MLVKSAGFFIVLSGASNHVLRPFPDAATRHHRIIRVRGTIAGRICSIVHTALDTPKDVKVWTSSVHKNSQEIPIRANSQLLATEVDPRSVFLDPTPILLAREIDSRKSTISFQLFPVYMNQLCRPVHRSHCLSRRLQFTLRLKPLFPL
ncbi:unnamed protein product [Somion occarium]|uniref:Uncharacterized protein n=1 Tax=Somion occarium TaxID=3059160 RepID=A0ABP1D7T5_9APHY